MTTNTINNAMARITKKYDELRKGYAVKVVKPYEFNPDNEQLAKYQVYVDSQKAIAEDTREILATYGENPTAQELLEIDYYTSVLKQANAYLKKEIAPLSKASTELKKALMDNGEKAQEIANNYFNTMFNCSLSINDYNGLIQFLATANKKQRGVKEQATSPLDLFFNFATERKAFLGDLSTKSAKATIKKAYSNIIIITEDEYCNGAFKENEQSAIVDNYITLANIKLKKDDKSDYRKKAQAVRDAVKNGKIALKPNTVIQREERAKQKALESRKNKKAQKEQEQQ